MTGQNHIFISYSRENQEFVQRLINAVEYAQAEVDG